MRTEAQREYARQWYLAHREEVKARSRRRYEERREECLRNAAAWKTANRVRVRELGRGYYERHSDEICSEQRERRHTNDEARRKYLARSTVSNAVRDGKLVRPDRCECGAMNPEAHHDDYDRPLDVRWLCSSCHGREHVRREP